MTTIGIYADWDGLAQPQKLGLLHSRKTRASGSSCEYFRLKLQDADEIIADFSSIVGRWRTLATRLALPAREQERMAGAFHLASA